MNRCIFSTITLVISTVRRNSIKIFCYATLMHGWYALCGIRSLMYLCINISVSTYTVVGIERQCDYVSAGVTDGYQSANHDHTKIFFGTLMKR